LGAKLSEKAWATGCKKSGLEGTLVDDLRRGGQSLRAGVPDAVAMEITGHKTRSMYRRYRIVDERDLREATERLQSQLENQDGAKVIPLRLIIERTQQRTVYGQICVTFMNCQISGLLKIYHLLPQNCPT
jgi:hypothetical protein